MSNNLVEAAAKVNRITAEIVAIAEQATQIAAMSAIRIGGLLKQAKEIVAPGEWGAYIEREISFSQRTASNCMRLHTEWEKNPNSQALADFNYTKAVRLLSLPEADRDEFIADHNVSDMSTRELDAAIRDLKAAQEEAAQLRRDLDTVKNIAEAAKVTAEKAQDAKRKADGAKIRLEAELQQAKNNPTVSPEILEKIREEAKAEAAGSMSEQLSAAQAQLADAKKQIAAAEAVQKASRLSDPDVAAFNVLLVQLQEQYNRLNGYRLKIRTKDEALYAGCTAAQAALVQEFGKAVVERDGK